MKKKIITLCMVLALALSAVVMTGCNLVYNVGVIEWVEKPATVYTLNDTTGLTFSIRAEIGETTNVYSYPGQEGITVKNFTTATVGTRTATVTYENLTLSFTYTVIDSKFAGGTGDEADPYKVSSPAQFQNMLDQKTFAYYVLTNTIDFSGYALRMANKGQKATNAEAWTGIIDGNGYSITGISKVLTTDGQEINKYNEIFGVIGKANEKFVMKNLTVDFASTGASATMGIAFRNGDGAQIEFENVKLTGYINAANSANSSIAPFINFINRNSATGEVSKLKSLTFKKCESDLKILNAYANNVVSGFAATMAGDNISTAAIKFDNCKFNGLVEGSYSIGVGAFFTGTNGFKASSLSFSNCTVGADAKIIKTAGLNSTAPMYDCGYVATLAGPASSTEIRGKEVGALVTNVETISNLTVNAETLQVTANVEGADKYEIYVVGGMSYIENPTVKKDFGGAFRFVQPVKDVTNGALDYPLKKIKYSAEDAPQNNADPKDASKYGTNLIVEDGNDLVYYGKSVCTGIYVKEATLVVVAYKEGKAIAFAQYATTLNLAA